MTPPYQAITDMVTGVPIPPGMLVLAWLVDASGREATPVALPVPAVVGTTGLTLAMDRVPEAEPSWTILRATLAQLSPLREYSYPTTLEDALHSANGTGPYMHRVDLGDTYAWAVLGVDTYLAILDWAKATPWGPWQNADQLIRSWLVGMAEARATEGHYVSPKVITRPRRNPEARLWPTHWGGLGKTAPYLEGGDQAAYHALMGALLVLQFLRYCGTPLAPSQWVQIAASTDQWEAIRIRARLATEQAHLY